MAAVVAVVAVVAVAAATVEDKATSARAYDLLLHLAQLVLMRSNASCLRPRGGRQRPLREEGSPAGQRLHWRTRSCCWHSHQSAHGHVAAAPPYQLASVLPQAWLGVIQLQPNAGPSSSHRLVRIPAFAIQECRPHLRSRPWRDLRRPPVPGLDLMVSWLATALVAELEHRQARWHSCHWPWTQADLDDSPRFPIGYVSSLAAARSTNLPAQ